MRFKKEFFVILCVAFLGYAAAFCIFNFHVMPRGWHLMYYLGTYEKSENEKGFSRFFIFRPFSKFVFKQTGRYCDSPYYQRFDKNEVFSDYTQGKDMTITMLVAAHSMGYPMDTQRLVYRELEDALKKCDPNIVGEGQPLSPLHSAILYRDDSVIALLLKNGTKLDSRIHRPGKRIDGLTPMAWANYLATRAGDASKKAHYQNIAKLIEDFQAGKSSVASMADPLSMPVAQSSATQHMN